MNYCKGLAYELFRAKLKNESCRDAFEISAIFLIEQYCARRTSESRLSQFRSYYNSRAINWFCMRYGFDGLGTKSYYNIASQFGVTLTVVICAINKLERILRHPLHRKHLEQYLEGMWTL